MANYYLDIKNGNVGSGGPHSDYILGQGKYEYKKDEVAHTGDNLPQWAKDSTEFFKLADENERGGSENNICKGRSYREIVISLPHELSLEQNKELVDDFIKKELGEKYYYSFSLHDKESNYKGEVQNIHAHIMFSQREIDGIKRSSDKFFKQANSKNPERGGCKKNNEWNHKDKLKELRKDWEIIQNKHLEKAGIEITVSCETLEKQKEIAIQKGDESLAKTLERDPINCAGYILQKIKEGASLSAEEKMQYEDFNRAREIRDITLEIYQMEQMRANILKQNDKLVELDKNIEMLTPEDYRKEDLKELANNIQLVNLEIIKTEHLLENNLDYLTYCKLEPEYEELKNKFDYLSENHGENEDISFLLERITAIEERIDSKIFEETKNDIKDALDSRLIDLSSSKIIEEEKLNEFVENNWTKENEKDIYDKVEVEFNNNLSNHFSLKSEIKKDEKELENVQRMSSKENMEVTALNILSKGEYSKLTKEIGKNSSELDYLKANIEHNIFKPKEMKIAKEKVEILSKKTKISQDKLEELNKKLNLPQMKNQKIRIIDSLEKKYSGKESELLNSLREKKLESNLLKNNFIDTEKTRKNVSDYIKKEYSSYSLSKAKLEKNKIIIGNIEKKFGSEQIMRISQNKLTGGKYLKYTKEYFKENGGKEEMVRKLKDFEKSYASRLMKSAEIKKLKEELREVEFRMEKIKGEFESLVKSIPTDKLAEEMIKFEDLKNNLLDKNKEDQKTIAEELTENYQKIAFAKELLEDFPKFEKEKFIGNIMNSLKSDEGKVVGASSVQLDKAKECDQIKF